jgi:hypothetical protein
MKKIHFLITLVCFGFSIHAQINFVPNPSFEDTAALCPDNNGQINRAKFWFRTNSTPDYFHICYNGPFNYSSVPSNSYGYQTPIGTNCKAYAGIYTAAPGMNNANETFATKLNDSLIKNNKYYFSCKVASSNFTKYTSNNIGVYFTTKNPKISLVDSPTNQCQITFTQTVIDSLNWVLLFNSFTADSNYKYVSIGNFKDSSLTSKTFFNPSGSNLAYYFLDNICVSSDSSFTYNYSYNCTLTSLSEPINENTNINIYPNPAKEKIVILGLNNTHKIKIFRYDGYVVLEKHLDDNCTQYQLEIENIEQGFYLIELSQNQKKIIKKLLIQK